MRYCFSTQATVPSRLVLELTGASSGGLRLSDHAARSGLAHCSGSPALRRPSRKLAAILAADVVGYSRPMGEDEAGAARAVREHREAAAPIVADSAGGSSRRWATACCWNFRPSSRRSSDSDAEADGRAKRRRSRGQAHPLPHRRQPRRRRQYRCAIGGHLQAGRRLHLRRVCLTFRAGGNHEFVKVH